MKKPLLFCTLLAMISCPILAQKSTYTTTGGEWIFSFADAKIGGISAANTVRFSPFFNIQTQVHRDFQDNFGLLTGFNIRNVGFIFDDPAAPNTYYKSRNYTIGIPIGLKFGKMDGKYIFAGYEFEIPFNYKEKKFVDENKTKFDEWFSNRVPSYYHTWFVGINLVSGAQLKFKYYMNNWFNKSFTTLDAATGLPVQPYANFDAHVFYVALSFQILKGTDFYYKREAK